MALNLPKKLLILEDNPFYVDILTNLIGRLYSVMPQVKFTDKLSEFECIAEAESFDAFIVDLNVLDARAVEVASVLEKLPQIKQQLVVVHSSESWVNIQRLGLSKYKVMPKGSTSSELLELLLEKDSNV